MLAIEKTDADFICNVIRKEMEVLTKGYEKANEETKELKAKADALGILVGDKSDSKYVELKSKLDKLYEECLENNKKCFDEEMIKYTKCLDILMSAKEIA